MTSPRVGRSSPKAMRMSVVFPAPFSPSRACTVPRSSRSEHVLSTAIVGPKRFVIPDAHRTARTRRGAAHSPVGASMKVDGKSELAARRVRRARARRASPWRSDRRTGSTMPCSRASIAVWCGPSPTISVSSPRSAASRSVSAPAPAPVQMAHRRVGRAAFRVFVRTTLPYGRANAESRRTSSAVATSSSPVTPMSIPW